MSSVVAKAGTRNSPRFSRRPASTSCSRRHDARPCLLRAHRNSAATHRSGGSDHSDRPHCRGRRGRRAQRVDHEAGPSRGGSAADNYPDPMRQAWPVTLAATAVLGMVSVAVSGSVLFVRQTAAGRIFSVATVPPAPAALVLGAQVHPDGTPSAFLPPG